MSDKKAFVFDTNFIIQNKNLKEVIENLNKNNYTVYVTQVAIDERIAQECVKQKGKYEKLAALSNETKDFATITIDKKYEDVEVLYKTGMQKKYSDHFGKNIIPYSQDSEMFAKILQRAFMKIPPFITSGTDKGFKDSLMWLSILDFFKASGENEIVFVSSDNGFKESTTTLCEEFNEVTGKTIVIKPNSYYNELLEAEKSEPVPKKPKPLPDFSLLRDRIHNTIYHLCFVISEDSWGNEMEEPVFLLSEKVDELDALFFFSGLEKTVSEHILEKDVPTEVVFSALENFSPVMYSVSINTLEHALRLYEEIQEKYSEYENQFYTAVVNMFNRNYAEPKVEPVFNDDDLPF